MSKPQVGDTANLLLRKLVDATRAIAPSASFDDAPQDGLAYVRRNGSWERAEEPIVDGIVNDYSALPVSIGSAKIDDVYLAVNATGTFFVNRHPAGLYVRVAANGNLGDWKYAATLTDSEE
jgi:hypothetical protein